MCIKKHTPHALTASPFSTTMDSIKLLEVFAAVLALLFIYCIWPKKAEKTRLLPPEASGAWPVVGHLGLLRGTTPLYRTLATLSEKQGPLFSLRLGQLRVVVVSSMDLAKECFTTNDRALASRPTLESWKRLTYDRAMFGFCPYGAYWRELRKITSVELLSNRRLELLKHVQREEVDTLVRTLYGSCGRDHPVDMKWCFSSLTMNIILRMVVGKRYFDLDAAGNSLEAKEFSKVLEELFYLTGGLTASDAMPWLECLDVGGRLKAMERVAGKIDQVASGWLAEHRQKEERCIAGSEIDFMDVLIRELQGQHLSEKYPTDIIIKATAMNLVAAATQTTSGTLEWTLSLLINNPHVLKKAQDELDSQVGKDRRVEESDVQTLTYLHAIVKESMRLHPVGPLLVPHQSMEPIQIGGYDIPAGTTLFINAWKIYRDPILWVDPEEFKPERFLTSPQETNFGGQNFAFMPFGLGRRMCPGWLLASQVLHLTLARLLHSFKWSTPMKEPVDMTEGAGLDMPKATPLKVLVESRLLHHLYYQ